MPKHRKTPHRATVTVAELAGRPASKRPTSSETFAALGVLLGILLTVVAIGAVLGAWF